MYRITVALVTVALVLLLCQQQRRVGMQVRATDQRVYAVVAAPDAAAAAAQLAAINAKNLALIAALRLRWPAGTRWGAATARLAEGYRSDRLSENNPTGTVNTSYTEGKGDAVALCLRDRPSRALHAASILEFVDLHELAHIASIEYGHEAEFWQTFEWLLGEAKRAGVHEPVDYAAHPVNYCGLDVTYNPYFEGASAA